ncbi:MAG: D-glycerate dehydrogenase [Planctomycetota bacterium]|nr:MAG: D-glycerate dehydrogenase [Planctomycetota bacterium]
MLSAPISQEKSGVARQSVFITRAIPEEGVAVLNEAGLTVHVNPHHRPLQPEELIKEVGRHDGVICQMVDRIDQKVLQAAAGRCRVIATCAVGYDNIDVAAAAKLGIVITHTPDVLTETTADLAWTLMLSAARRAGEGERVVRAGQWRGWGMMDFLGTDVFGKTLGIVGAGRIGTAVARRASGFRMKLLYHARTSKPEMEALGARRVALNELLESSDFVSLHVPLTEETRHLIDEKALGRMKRDAILINSARGAVVDQDALIAALAGGRLAAAGLDVYAHEPAVPPELVRLENVVLLPHIGSATVATRTEMARRAARNVVAVLRGEAAPNPVRLP